MASILTFPADASGIPKVEPPSTPPSDYENIQTNPRQFGAQIGAAEEKLGEGALKVSHVYGQLAGQQAAQGYQDESEKIVMDFLGKHNQEAMEAQPGVISQLKALREKYAGMVSTADSQIEFANETRFLSARQQGQIGTHYDAESKAWGGGISETRYQNAIADAALHPEDEGTATQALATANSARIQKMQMMGQLPRDISQLTPDQAAIMASEQRKTSIDLTEARIKSLAVRNPALAQKLYDDNASLLSASPHYDALGYSLAGHAATAQRAADKARDDAIVDGIFGGATPGTTGPRSGGPAPQAPAQYAPLIKKAADQYAVPEELLTRVLSAENGFRPTGVSPKGARGIAQFLPSTAADYGINPDIPEEAIPGAAHYLADLKAQHGTWNGAVRDYLGGDPHNDASYKQNGVPQLIDSLDRGGAQPVMPPFDSAEGRAFRGEAAAFDHAAGDSIAVQQIHHQPKLGSAADFKTGQDLPGTARVGAGGPEVLRRINDEVAANPKAFAGVNFLSSGASNDPDHVGYVGDQIDALKKGGATAVVVPGVGPGVRNAAAVNVSLKSVVEQHGGVFFEPQVKWQADGIHPAEVDKVRDQGLAALKAAQPGGAPTALVTPPNFDTQHAEGMVKPGNLDPWHRPVLHNPDGSYSTTSSMSIGTDAGEVLIPTVMGHPPGRLSNEDAIAHFKATGENLGTFATPAAADAYATALHNAQASMYDANGNPKAAPPPDQLQGQPAPSPMTAPVPYLPSREEMIARIPQGLSEESYNRVLARTNQRYSHMLQATSADRAQALSQFKGGLAMLQDGREFNYDPNTYRRLFPKENADQMIGDLDDARAIGQQIQTVRGMPLTDIATQVAANNAVLGTSTGEGYAHQKKRADAFLTAAERHIKALGEDPAGYIEATNPEIERARQATASETAEQSAALRGEGSPDAVESFAAKLLGEQERLQVPEEARHVLTNTQAVAAARQITGNPEQAPAMLKSMQQRWGAAWPEVWRDIAGVGKLSPAYQMVGALEDEGDGALMARGLAQANKEGVNVSLDKLIDTKVAGAVKPSMLIAQRIAGDENIQQYKRSLVNSGVSINQAEGVVAAIGLLAKAKVLYHDEDPAAAADHAVESAIGNWQFMPNGGARVPRANFDAVTDNARAVVDGLRLDQLKQPQRFAQQPATPGIPQADDWLRQLKAAPNWSTVGQSIRLMDTGGRFVRRTDGSFVEVPFNAKPVTNPAAAAAIGPTGIPQ